MQHNTYTSRILELNELGDGLEAEDKELPERPVSEDQSSFLSAQVGSYDESRAGNFLVGSGGQPSGAETSQSTYSSPRRPPVPKAPKLSIDASSDQRDAPSGILQSQFALHSAFSRARPDINSHGLTLQMMPMESAYIPPPLSPRRPISPGHPPPPPPSQVAGHATPDMSNRPNLTMSGALLAPAAAMGHQRANSHESVSWLDPIDESAGSSASSVHSRSSMNIKRRHIRAASGDTEAEFDAALDDAIEAAYDDGYEPDAQYTAAPPSEEPIDPVANTLRRVELARERVRESEREVLELANERERRLRLQQQLEDEEYRQQGGVGTDLYDGNGSDDEERFLEEMTSGYVIEDFAFGIQPRPPVPRESDSSGWTSRTWHSSMGSNPPTATTVLTTVSEHDPLPQPSKPLAPPPTQALPQVPPQPLSAGSQSSIQSVRNRRLSGQNAKQLKIETSRLGDQPAPATAGPAIPAPPKSGSYIVQQRQALSAGPNRTTGPLSARPAVPSPVPPTSMDDVGLSSIPIGLVQDDLPRSGSPSVSRPVLRKNFSSSSLRSMKSRNLSVSNIDEASDISPGTPLSSQYGIGSSTRLPAIPSLPTPLTSAFNKERSNSTAAGGLYLFDNQFHAPNSPGSPNPMLTDAPAPLEACPNDVTLRPFWLMRCLYQTLCHPRGGYVSNKLFVPRDVWQVKGVKLKNLEDKIASCDLLTAALQKLIKVDTCDADAVLEEMQSFENVIEQVQATLTRRLGAEVGVQGSSIMFKDANGPESDASSMPRSASVAKKANSTSALWQRIRNKGSSANMHTLPGAYGGKGGSGTSGAMTPVDGIAHKDLPLSSLPMTSHPTSRPTKRDIGSVVFAGPNATYMGSLARLFDAAQAVGKFLSWCAGRAAHANGNADQIARQVEDPGLRHADKTQVGLELCTRHAAEFFCFFICRFVLSDMTLLLDKFIKRGSEWVLA